MLNDKKQLRKVSFDFDISDDDSDSKDNRKRFADQKVIKLKKWNDSSQDDVNGNCNLSKHFDGRIYRLNNFYGSPYIVKPRHHYQKDYPESEEIGIFET